LSREGLPAVYSGAPASYEISGIAESNNPFIGVGDFKLLVKVRPGQPWTPVQQLLHPTAIAPNEPSDACILEYLFACRIEKKPFSRLAWI